MVDGAVVALRGRGQDRRNIKYLSLLYVRGVVQRWKILATDVQKITNIDDDGTNNNNDKIQRTTATTKLLKAANLQIGNIPNGVVKIEYSPMTDEPRVVGRTPFRRD
ncbi:hypothetical protein MMC07_003232 [Pseudocyphellaria aurata]|nr:hypothetical protein [Pseudocyphellaria aurata]